MTIKRLFHLFEFQIKYYKCIFCTFSYLKLFTRTLKFHIFDCIPLYFSNNLFHSTWHFKLFVEFGIIFIFFYAQKTFSLKWMSWEDIFLYWNTNHKFQPKISEKSTYMCIWVYIYVCVCMNVFINNFHIS